GEQCPRPFAVEQHLRIRTVRGRHLQPLFRTRQHLVKREDGRRAAALGALVPVPVVGKEMPERAEQKRPKATTFTDDGLEGVLLDQRVKKIMQEILRVSRGVPAPTNEAVKRLAVGLIQ